MPVPTALKKTLTILFSLLLVGGLLWTFRGTLSSHIPFLKPQPSPTPSHVTLTYWGLWEAKANIQPLIDQYQAENPNVTINYQMRDAQDYFETVRVRINTDLTPDIVRIHNTWVWALKDSLSPIPSTTMDKETFEQTFYPVCKQTLQYGGNIFALPLEIDGLALLYNQDLFNQAGISGPPKDWDEFRNIVGKLTQKDEGGSITVAGAAFGYADINHFSDILGLLFAQNGVEFVNEKGEVQFNKSFSPDQRNLGAEALTFYSLFGTTALSWNPKWENSTLAFAQGKVGMIFAPSFRIFDILGQNPNLNLKVAPVPQLASGEKNWGTFWVEAVPKKSPHTQEAWKFLKFLTEKQRLIQLYQVASATRPFGEPYSRVDLAESLKNNKYLGPYISQAPTYTSWPFADATWDEAFNDKIIKVLGEMVENVNAGQPVEEALNRAAQGVQEILDSF